MAETEVKKPSGSSKLIPALLGINSLAIVGVAALMFLRPSGGAAAAVVKAPAGEHGEKPKEGEHGEKPKEGEHGEKPKEGEHGEKPKEGEHGGGETKPASSSNAPTLRLPDFVVHLRNPEVDRYARITFELQLGNEADKAKVEARVPQLRDSFLAYLSDRTVEDLRGSEGLEKTKAALLERMPGLVPGTKIEAIYITDMVVQ